MERTETGSRAKRPAKRRTQEERSATTRSQLVQAAVACIAQLGLNKATFSAIAAKAGLTSGAVQHHFQSRDELLLAVVVDFGKSLADTSDTAHAKNEPIASRVRRIFERYWGLFSSPQFLAIMKIWLGTQGNVAVYREMLDHMHWFEIRFDREWVELFSDCPADPETIAAARHVALGAMRGLALSLSYSVDRSGAKAEVALLESMLVRTLEGDGKKPARRAGGQAKTAG
ncbi:TetR/AcrR family transcriptional regulator [Polaromonas sp. YR568]|uniref:TetR/AcrR family transcriptional regulator n=1 Tax=Polaromonas sp. YR568 TaxID=1855301 RepID=UPI0015873F71|nr:TetR/AcrR family transcriptional regulator [Polaromonas sp. YR568]